MKIDIKLLIVVVFMMGIGSPSFLVAEGKIDNQVEFRKVFRNQVALNTQVCIVKSSYANDDTSWVSDTSWSSSDHQNVILSFIVITQELLDAALDYWQIGRSDLSVETVEDYRRKLMKCL